MAHPLIKQIEVHFVLLFEILNPFSQFKQLLFVKQVLHISIPQLILEHTIYSLAFIAK